jgi:hypothetical protein
MFERAAELMVSRKRLHGLRDELTRLTEEAVVLQSRLNTAMIFSATSLPSLDEHRQAEVAALQAQRAALAAEIAALKRESTALAAQIKRDEWRFLQQARSQSARGQQSDE